MIATIVGEIERIPSNKKSGWLTAWLGAIIVLVMLLAAGLPRLTLSDGVTYHQEWTHNTIVDEINIPLVIMVNLFVILLIVLFYLHQWRRYWRGIWLPLLFVGLLVTPCIIISAIVPMLDEEIVFEEEEEPPGDEEEELETAAPLPDLGTATAVEPFTPPPAWVGLLVSTGIAFLLLLTVISFYLFSKGMAGRQKEPEEDEIPFTEVTRQAQTAITALRQGQPLADVVLRCYADMEQTLRTAHGIERRRTMTAREFERQLVQLHFPAEAIRTLTRLFETVRYGRYTPNPEDQTAAVDSLTQIVATRGKG